MSQSHPPGKYGYMVGQSITYPPLLELYNKMNQEQVTEEFLPTTGNYEVTSYAYGIKMMFNKNFILKEIQFYDSGYTYSAFQDTLPFGLDFKMTLSAFENYKYPDFVKDSFNTYVYHADFDLVHVKTYFKSNNIEIVKLYASDSFLTAQDSRLSSEWGMRIIPDGKCVSGNCFEGVGKMKWPTGLEYEGEWTAAIPHGAGRLLDSTGIEYVGGFKLGFLWGEGKLKIPGQFTYSGEMVYGKRVGQGNATFANGTKYKGEWDRDQMHGEGHFWFSNSYHYKGEFARNQFNGEGKLTSPEGYVEGSFLNGKPHGYCEQVVVRSQTKLSGYWVNGKKEGKFSLYNPLQGTRTLQFKHDKEI
jgi:hypothetical protein